jgi:hypothetical protein
MWMEDSGPRSSRMIFPGLLLESATWVDDICESTPASFPRCSYCDVWKRGCQHTPTRVWGVITLGCAYVREVSVFLRLLYPLLHERSEIKIGCIVHCIGWTCLNLRPVAERGVGY